MTTTATQEELGILEQQHTMKTASVANDETEIPEHQHAMRAAAEAQYVAEVLEQKRVETTTAITNETHRCDCSTQKRKSLECRVFNFNLCFCYITSRSQNLESRVFWLLCRVTPWKALSLFPFFLHFLWRRVRGGLNPNHNVGTREPKQKLLISPEEKNMSGDPLQDHHDGELQEYH